MTDNEATWRLSIRTDMRKLAYEMQTMNTSMQAMQSAVKDIQGRLNDAINAQFTKGDLEVVHFELGRIVDRLDRLEGTE